PYFQQAIDKDPNYALAHSGLADTYALLSVFGADSPAALMPQAKTAALKALALDNNMAEAHASLGQIMWYYDWDFAGAQRELKRAIDLNPNYATAHQWYAETLSSIERHDEALAEIRRALEIEPVSVIINRVYGDLLLDARRYDEAIAQCSKTLEMDPSFVTTHNCLGRAYQGKGMYDETIAQYMQFSGRVPLPPEELSHLKEVYVRSGWNAFLQERLKVTLERERSKKVYVSAYTIAVQYARLSKKDEAFAWLERSFEARDYQMTQIKVRQEFDSLRDDPQFTALLRRVGFPQ
ncbi:MAG: tetratricopeptide repeat protein, partial [Pyrinomonadaceae bacterium]